MLKKALLLTLTLTTIAACSSKKEKVRLEGERISIKPEETTLIPDSEVQKVALMLPNQINFYDWTQEGGFADNAPLHPKLGKEVHKIWEESIGKKLNKNQSFNAPPIVYSGKVYTLNTSHEIIALNAETGKKEWEFKLESEFDESEIITPGALAIDGSTLVAVLSSGEIYAMNLVTESIIWNKDLSEPLRSAPSIKDGRVFVSHLSNKLSVFDIANGNLLWEHSGLPEKLTMLGDSSPAIAQDIVVVTYSSGEIYALDIKTGGEIWSDTLATNSTFEMTENILDVVASPVIVGNFLHIVNYNGRLITIALKTGEKYWSRNVSSITTPWIAGNSIFIVAENGLLANVYRKTGQVRWVVNLNKTLHEDLKEEDRTNAIFTAPFLAGGRVFVASNKGFIASYDPNTGQIIGRHNVKESITTSPVIANKTIYFLTDSSNIIAYKEKPEEPKEEIKE